MRRRGARKNVNCTTDPIYTLGGGGECEIRIPPLLVGNHICVIRRDKWRGNENFAVNSADRQGRKKGG